MLRWVSVEVDTEDVGEPLVVTGSQRAQPGEAGFVCDGVQVRTYLLRCG
jgi:hypothetical protein